MQFWVIIQAMTEINGQEIQSRCVAIVDRWVWEGLPEEAALVRN